MTRTCFWKNCTALALPGMAALLLSGPLSAMAAVPRPEHPRPDALRDNWMTLNGPWQFEIDRKGDGEARGLISGKDLTSTIIVPFCPESKLSGLGLGNTEYFTQRLVPAADRAARGDEGQTHPAALRRRRLQDLGLCQRQAGGHAHGRKRRIQLRNHATLEGRRERTSGPRVRRSAQRPAGRRQAGVQQERRLRVHPHHGHLAAGLAGSGRLVVRGEPLDRARSGPRPRADRGRGQRRGRATCNFEPRPLPTASRSVPIRPPARGATSGWC